MAYPVTLIDQERSSALVRSLSEVNHLSSKADISGICVELFTTNRDFLEMWTENFYHTDDHVRSHARIFCLDDPSVELHAEYDVPGRTIFLFNFDYYGWVKSVALGIAGNILEDVHGIFPVHGAALDIDGAGVTLIAPSKTGKTTQSWGLLRGANTHLVTDDWYFVEFGCGRPVISCSEKNCYIDADIGDVWEEYGELVKDVRFDNRGRGIGNVRWVKGKGSMVNGTSMRYVFLLKRDNDDETLVRQMQPDEAVDYLVAHDFCNPHQLLRDGWRMARRTEFFRRYFSQCEVFMVNTRLPARETQEQIRNVLRGRCSI